jgi:hypothetical protein
MISDGAFSIFKRFSAREKTFHEMPVEENDEFMKAPYPIISVKLICFLYTI